MSITRKNYRIKIMILLIIFIFLLPFIGIIIESLNLKNWNYILSHKKTFDAIKNTCLIAVIAVILNIFIGTPIGSYLGQNEFRGKKIIEIIVLLPIIIPSFVTTMGIQFFFIKLNLIETYLGVGIIHSIIAFPYYIRSIANGYSTLNKDYEKMGRILGGNSLDIFWKINLPILFPSFIVGISLVIIVSFAQYLVTLIIGGGEIITIPILMFPFISGGDFKIGAIYSIIFIGINMVLILFVEKSIENFFSIKKKVSING